MTGVEDSSIDWVAATTLVVAAATLLLALATFWLGRQAKAEVGIARTSELARRSELHILEADPLTAQPTPWDHDDDGQPFFMVQVTNVGDRPVTAITATIRSNDNDASESPGWDTLAPGQWHNFTFHLSPYLHYENPETREGLVADVRHCEVVIESHGIFGQRVLQTFLFRIDRIAAGLADNQWYLTRQEVVPAVQGGTSAVTTFNGAA